MEGNDAISENTAAASAAVQHVTRKCSDELLKKFADSGDEESPRKGPSRVSKRRKRNLRGSVDEGDGSESPVNSLVERRSLLPPIKKRSVLLRRLGIAGKSQQLRTRDIRNKSLRGAIEKTWRRTLEGASRVFMEKHYYNRHKRLISDVV